jgi:AAA15 family ATPase/GTPase
MLKLIEILGFRGFASNQTLEFAMPDGNNRGSGLTVVVGANNTGKSTVIEALRAMIQSETPSFSMGRRNSSAGDFVKIRTVEEDEKETILESIQPRTSETKFSDPNRVFLRNRTFILNSRRAFNPYFGRATANRESYNSNLGFSPVRLNTIDRFNGRLFAAQKNRQYFDKVLQKVVNPVPNWSIDQTDTGQYFLRIDKGDGFHSSDGLGEGLVSLFFIIDSLYDSKPGDLIAIDEPELSLHPEIQRKLDTHKNLPALIGL